MQTQGNVYAKLLFDVAETRLGKRWLCNWSIAVQAVTDDGLDLQPHHSECSLQRMVSGRKLSERKEIQLKVQEMVAWGCTGKGKAENTFPQADTGEECTSKSYRTHLWHSYGKVVQGVGRTQQTGCRSGMNETNRRVFAWLGVWRKYFKFTYESAKQQYNLITVIYYRSSERSEKYNLIRN